jgi:molecular chaperone GrpE
MKQQKENKEEKVSKEDLRKEESATNIQDNKTEENAADAKDAAEEGKELTPEEKIKELEGQIAELKNAMLYKAAEFDNYRKRTLKEKADLILNGGKKVIEAMLPIADDLERAEASMEKATEVAAVKEGLQLIFQKFNKTLEGLGLKKMETAGEDFCTDFHEAVAFVPADDDHKGKVVDCIQNGYLLNDQVIRYAKVAVGQ